MNQGLYLTSQRTTTDKLGIGAGKTESSLPLLQSPRRGQSGCKSTQKIHRWNLLSPEASQYSAAKSKRPKSPSLPAAQGCQRWLLATTNPDSQKLQTFGKVSFYSDNLALAAAKKKKTGRNFAALKIFFVTISS